ncbi:hypothetical protein KKA27_00810 [Patescibacteria group bacterium]|nr:hypothetical protein [Patescibacteria group bacterium]MBU2633039.1 hypothetical protein [Patescibacteria group bacterium]
MKKAGIRIGYFPKFIRQYNVFGEDLRAEIKEKINLLKDPRNHEFLKVHKLRGYFKGCYSFSVNYKTRIVFEYVSKREIALLAIGDHDVYKK